VFRKATRDGGNWASFRDGFRELLGEIEETVATTGEVPGVRQDALSDSCYALVLQLWSSLVFADKTSAAGTKNDEQTYAGEPPSLQQIDEYVSEIEASVSTDPEGTRTERLNHYRSRARESVLTNIEEFVTEGGGVATITLPTGMGKTLTGVSAALALRNRLHGERVVYALPFTSIIDQVVDELEGIYKTDTKGRLLTAHHHLAETTIQTDETDAEEADRNDDIAGMLAESWRAGLTVSTFVQLFESLAGPKNRQSLKLPALHDSVIVLDEPQSLPLDWWKLVPRLVSILTEQYDATVIAMTATQPQLFDNPTRLVDDPEVYFEAVNRVSYELDDSVRYYSSKDTGPKSYDEAAYEIRSALDAEKSALAVCNTIDSAQLLTDCLSDSISAANVAEAYAIELESVGDVDAVDPTAIANRIAATNDPALLHLSTRLRPADRLTLIETAKRLTEQGHALAVVSTQLIEAGVDISFDHVFRDFAPIDSIVQAAGRCNRSFESERGRVLVWWLDAPGDQPKTPAEAIYNRGVSLLPVVADTLEAVRDEVGELTETAVARRAVTEYYDRLHDEKNVGKKEYADYVDDAKAKELAELSLIDQKRSVDVFVVRTETERGLVEQIRRAEQEYDFELLRKLLDETKPLRLSIPVHRDDSETAEAIGSLAPIRKDEGLYELDVRQHGSHFDQTKGFVIPDSSVDHQFI
jgi:superfamily II DNA or RNA helicase